MNLVLLITAWSSICPIFIVYMMLMDQIFILNTTILTPIAFLFGHICGITCMDNLIDESYMFLFQMRPHEVSGFRRMRTITQVIFETFV